MIRIAIEIGAFWPIDTWLGMPSIMAARLGPMLLAGNTDVVSAARVYVLSNV